MSNVTCSQAESALSLVREREDPQAEIDSAACPLKPFDVPDADLIIRSSDSVDFRVHKPVLSMASPVFKDLLSLPQPPDSETVDGLPVVRLPEGSELLNSLVSMLYPVCTVIPNSYDKVLCLLATSPEVILTLTTRCCISSRRVRSTRWLQYSRLSVPRSSAGNSQRRRESRPTLHMRSRVAEGSFQKWKMQAVRP